jgi:aspartokinase
MTDKIECGGLIERSSLCLVEVLGFDWRPGLVCGILGKFGQVEISLSYLSMGNGPDGDKNMSFCLNPVKLAAHPKILDEVRQEYAPKKIEVREPVSILTLYGPHFLEKHNLASEVFSALCVDGIDAHTVCSSVNSISVVVDAEDRDRTAECLKQKFIWPE